MRKFTITKSQEYALNMIYGLSSKAFHLVVMAEHDESGRTTLSGTEDEFEALISDLAEEIYSELSPKTRLKHLISLYSKLRPDYDIF